MQALYPDLAQYQQSSDAMKADFDLGGFGVEKDGSFVRAISQIGKGFGE